MPCKPPFYRHNFGGEDQCKRCAAPKMSSTDRSRELRARTAEFNLVRLADYLTIDERDHLKGCLKKYRAQYNAMLI